ncbi:hypothetical protein XA22_13715 [Staphylococcus cohnii subsp. cohnii]|nr:hypothetical protein XA22_13715 [Staphylococcus cohnii subsp. cohnii]KKD25198.1 hypothetical protein XA21_02805 [Staphylococcus cohnii subsp. cohnii]
MAYENKIAIESCIKKVHEQQGTTEKVQQIINELEMVYRKAKAYDKLVEFYPQKDEIPSDEFFMMMGYIIKELTDDER